MKTTEPFLLSLEIDTNSPDILAFDILIETCNTRNLCIKFQGRI